MVVRQVVSEDVGLALDKIDISKLGSAKKVCMPLPAPQPCAL